MKVRILDIVADTVVDGPGLRTSVYFAGCKHKCPGCHIPQSWDMNGGYEIEVDDLVEKILETGNTKITISGGDPLYQPEGLYELTKKLKERGIKDIWCYTGFRYEELIYCSDLRGRALTFIDTLVDGPFLESCKDSNLEFRGSSNQRIIQLCNLRGIPRESRVSQ